MIPGPARARGCRKQTAPLRWCSRSCRPRWPAAGWDLQRLPGCRRHRAQLSAVDRRRRHGFAVAARAHRRGARLSHPPHRQNMLLNWRGQPFTYRLRQLQRRLLRPAERRTSQRPQDEFKGKIVSSARPPRSLFDIKPTSMSKQFPGRGDPRHCARQRQARRLHPRAAEPLARSASRRCSILWATALGFLQDIEAERFARVFGLSQVGLLVISYLSINLTNFYLQSDRPGVRRLRLLLHRQDLRARDRAGSGTQPAGRKSEGGREARSPTMARLPHPWTRRRRPARCSCGR